MVINDWKACYFFFFFYIWLFSPIYCFPFNRHFMRFCFCRVRFDGDAIAAAQDFSDHLVSTLQSHSFMIVTLALAESNTRWDFLFFCLVVVVFFCFYSPSTWCLLLLFFFWWEKENCVHPSHIIIWRWTSKMKQYTTMLTHIYLVDCECAQVVP